MSNQLKTYNFKLSDNYFSRQGQSAEVNNLNKIASSARGGNFKLSDEYAQRYKKQKRDTDLDLVFEGLKGLEKGNLVLKTNNPIAVLYTDELSQKFGAVRGPKLPQQDNPENRNLYTAEFPSNELGAKAGKFIIQKIYDNVDGDMETFASVYSLGKTPSQLINDRERTIAKRYFETLTSVSSKDDLDKTIERKENDVSSAILEEIDRLKSSKVSFDDISSMDIFQPTKVDTFQPVVQKAQIGFSRFRNPERKDELELVWDEDLEQVQAPDKEKLNLPEVELLEQTNNLRNQYSLSTAPDIAGDGRVSNLLELAKSKVVEYMIDNTLTEAYDVVGRPNATELGNLAVYAVSNTLDLPVAIGRSVDALGDFLFKGEIGAIGEELKAYHDFLMISAPESIVNLITATGFSPDPRANRFTEEGKIKVQEAREQLATNPLMPIFASLAIKGAVKSTKKAGKLSAELDKTYQNDIKPIIEQNIELVKQANALAKKEIAYEDASPAIKAVADKIKDTQALDIAISLMESKKSVSELKSSANKLDVNKGIGISKGFQKELKDSDFYTGDVKLLPSISTATKRNQSDIDLPASVSDNIIKTNEQVLNKQAQQAYEDMKKLTVNIANTRRKLEDPNLTDNQRSLHQKSLQQASDLLVKNVNVLGQQNGITYLNAGFPLLNPKKVREFYRTVKTISKNAKLKDFFDSDTIEKIIRTGVKPSIYSDKNIKTIFQDDMHKQIDASNLANKMYRESQSLTKEFKLDKTQFLFDEIGTKFFSPSFGINRRLKKLVDEDNTELAKKVRAEKDALLNSGTDINVRFEHNAQKIFGGLNGNQFEDLKNYINIRKINQLYLRKKEQVETTYPKKILSAPDKKTKTRYQEKLRNAKKYIQNLKKGEQNTFVRAGAPEEFLKTVKNPDIIRERAESYFNYNRELVDMRRKANLINDETADSWKVFDYEKTEYLYEVIGTNDYVNAKGEKISLASNGVRAMKEGDVEHVLNDPMLLMQHNLIGTINSIKRNNANFALVNLLNSKDIKVNYKNSSYNTKGIDGIGFIPKKGQVDKSKYEVIKYFDEGLERTIALDKRFADGWLTRDRDSNSKFLNYAGWATGAKTFQLTTTGINPILSPMMFALDIATVASTQHKYSLFYPKRLYQMASDYKDTFKDAQIGSRSPLVREATENGLTFYTLSRQSRVPLPKKARKALKNVQGAFLNRFDIKRKAGSQDTNAQYIKSGVDFSNLLTYGLNDFFENWTKLALYKRSRKLGIDRAESARQASTGYIVYNDAGSFAKKLNNLIPYFSPAMQATRLYGRTFAESPIKTGVIGLQIAGLTYATATLLNEYWFDEESRNIYDRIPEFDKINYYIIPSNTTRVDEQGIRRDEYLKIARKDDLGKYISLITEMSYNYTFDKKAPDGFYLQTLKELLKNNFATFSQLPPVYKAILAMHANQSSYYSKIYRGEDNVENYLKTNPNTDDLYRDVGKLFNLPPAQLKYASEQYVNKRFPASIALHAGYSTLRKKFSEEDRVSLDDSFNEYFDKYGLKDLRETYLGQANTRNFKKTFEYNKLDKQFKSNRLILKQAVDTFLINHKNTNDVERQVVLEQRFKKLLRQVKNDFGSDEYDIVTDYYKKQLYKNKTEITRSLYDEVYNSSPELKALSIVDNVTSMNGDFESVQSMLEDVYDMPNFLTAKTIKEANTLFLERYNTINDDGTRMIPFKITLNPKQRKKK